tara:strand:- start:182 stop:415 length:234 start_codon:yes stop_codon:yes gene_type:complete
MTYKTEDGELIKGNSPLELLTDLKNGSRFGHVDPLEVYLEKFIHRINEFNGTMLTYTGDHEKTVQDLVEVGFWVVMK